jgi:hypothetical protein
MAWMRLRKLAKRAAREAPASGTANGGSPFRFGQDRSLTRHKLELGFGPKDEIRRKRANLGVGDEAAWSTGTLSQHLGKQRL